MDATIALPVRPECRDLPAADKALNRLLGLAPDFGCHDSGSPQRSVLEDYIAQRFRQAYGAAITEFLPVLLSMQCDGQYSAVAGLRAASQGPLFIERYFDDPIEHVLSVRCHSTAQRRHVVEIGNLSASHRGATLLFFVVLAGVLQTAGYEWAVFSATAQVQKIADKLGFVTTRLANADPVRLGAAASHWGRYYETRPVVIAADVPATLARLVRAPLAAATLRFFHTTTVELARRVEIPVIQ